VHVEWEFDIDPVVQLIKEIDEDRLFKISYHSPSRLLIEAKGGGVLVGVFGPNFDYTHILPISVQSESPKVPLPGAYLYVTAVLLYLRWLEGDGKVFDVTFPPLTMKIVYKDIGNNTHKKTFSVQPSLGVATAISVTEQPTKANIVLDCTEHQ
jgi:hypothetical protein